jgi:hypothetical protein
MTEAMKDLPEGIAHIILEMDRNARAYGWEIGRGQLISPNVYVSEDNPFMDEDWRDAAEEKTETESDVRAKLYDEYRWNMLEIADGRCPQDPDGLHNYSGTICVYCDAMRPEFASLQDIVDYPIVVDNGEDLDMFRKES